LSSSQQLEIGQTILYVLALPAVCRSQLYATMLEALVLSRCSDIFSSHSSPTEIFVDSTRSTAAAAPDSRHGVKYICKKTLRLVRDALVARLSSYFEVVPTEDPLIYDWSHAMNATMDGGAMHTAEALSSEYRSYRFRTDRLIDSVPTLGGTVLKVRDDVLLLLQLTTRLDYLLAPRRTKERLLAVAGMINGGGTQKNAPHQTDSNKFYSSTFNTFSTELFDEDVRSGISDDRNRVIHDMDVIEEDIDSKPQLYFCNSM
jgi:hypothetical protein